MGLVMKVHHFLTNNSHTTGVYLLLHNAYSVCSLTLRQRSYKIPFSWIVLVSGFMLAYTVHVICAEFKRGAKFTSDFALSVSADKFTGIRPWQKSIIYGRDVEHSFTARINLYINSKSLFEISTFIAKTKGIKLPFSQMLDAHGLNENRQIYTLIYPVFTIRMSGPRGTLLVTALRNKTFGRTIWIISWLWIQHDAC